MALLSDNELTDVQKRVMSMFYDTIDTIELIEQNADVLFRDNEDQIRSAINEYLDDFIRNRSNSGEISPTDLINKTPKEDFQRVGLYGVQLDNKERHVTQANAEVREGLAQRLLSSFRRPFKKWIDRINPFLGSLASATGVGEALKELKDFLRNELPDDDDE